jgi:hypothetical protein
MVVKEVSPALGAVVATASRPILANTGPADVDAQLERSAVKAQRGAPQSGFLAARLTDPFSHLYL